MWFLFTHCAAVCFMTGVIWTMQILNYPLLAKVGADTFCDYEQAHNARFIRIVGPGVGATLLANVGLLITKPPALGWAGPIAAALVLTVIVASTALIQGPAHARLASGFDRDTHLRLVQSNWIRTGAWTLLATLDLWMLTQT